MIIMVQGTYQSTTYTESALDHIQLYLVDSVDLWILTLGDYNR